MASILKEAYNYYSRIISKELVPLQRVVPCRGCIGRGRFAGKLKRSDNVGESVQVPSELLK